MAKTITFIDFTTPTNLTLTAVAGGTLDANTTYYYSIIGVVKPKGGAVYQWDGRTRATAETSVQTTATDRSVQIQFNMPKGEMGSYRVFRSTTAGGTINNVLSIINLLPADVDVNTNGTVVFTDTGFAVGSNCYLSDLDVHGKIELAGSTSTDVFSIIDLYNADVAGNWGVIKKLDGNTYQVNAFIVFHDGMYWAEKDKTIISYGGFDATKTNTTFTTGEIDGNKTARGCDIIFSSEWLSNFTITNLYSYNTVWRTRQSYNSTYSPTNFSGVSFTNGLVQDCLISSLRNFVPLGGTNNAKLKNITYIGFDNAFSSGSATFENVRLLTGSRAYQSSVNGQTITGRGLYVEGAQSGVMLFMGLNVTVNLIDSQFDLVGGCLVDSTGSVFNDKVSLNMNITDSEGNPIEATIKVYDRENIETVNTTSDIDGKITEQLLTRDKYTVNNKTISSADHRYPFKIIVSKPGYETYEEIVSYSASIPIIKTVALKKAIDVMLSPQGFHIKADPTNTTDRELLLN